MAPRSLKFGWNRRQPALNTGGRYKTDSPWLPAVGNAEALANRHGGVLEIRAARNPFQILADLLGMGENVVGDYQHFSGELGQKNIHHLGEFPAIGVEEHEIKRPEEFADDFRG